MGTGSFPGVKRPGGGVDHLPHQAPRLKEEYSYTSTPSLGLRGLFWGELFLLRFISCSHHKALSLIKVKAYKQCEGVRTDKLSSKWTTKHRPQPTTINLWHKNTEKFGCKPPREEQDGRTVLMWKDIVTPGPRDGRRPTCSELPTGWASFLALKTTALRQSKLCLFFRTRP